MSKNTQAFLIFGFLLSLVLVSFPFQEEKLVLRRLLPEWRQFEKGLRKEIASSCRTLSTPEKSPLAKLLVKRLATATSEISTSVCEIKIEESSNTRFALTTKTNLRVVVLKVDSQTTLGDETFSVRYPRPLCFLPICLFFVSLLLGKTVWGLGLSFCLYVFLLFNFNFIEAFSRTFAIAELVISTDKTWLGFTLLSFFLLLNRQELAAKGLHRISLTDPEKLMNRSLMGAVGLWNPAFFTYLFTLFFKKGNLKRLTYYFDAQLLVTVLSVYLFSIKDRFSLDGIQQTLFLPRYFTFAVCLALFVAHGGGRHFKRLPLWVIPGFRRHLLAVVGIELAALLWHPLTIFPTLTRVSLALLLSQLFRQPVIHWRKFIQDLSQPVAWIFLSALVSMMSLELGVVDLALVIFEPSAHPSVLTLFTYLSGIFIGVLTGSFSTSFFALVPMLLKSQSNPIVRAALLDGILAGSLLSPFSLFTLLPVAILKVPLDEVLRFRMQRLALPLFVAGAVYALSAVNSVAILRPVTFIFLCLGIVVFRLHRNDWKMGKVWPWEIRLPKLNKNETV